MKGRGKRKFFKCLEPSGVHGGGRKSKRSSPARKEATDDGRNSKRSIDGDAFDDTFSNGDFPNDRPEKSRRSFSRTLKAVLFETSLSRKFRRKGPCLPILESKDADSSQIEKMKNLSSLDEDSKQSRGTEENLRSRSSDMWDSSLLHSSSFTTTTTSTLSSSRASSRSASDRKISEMNEEATTTTNAKAAPLTALKPPRPTAVAAAVVMKEPIVPSHVTKGRHCNLRIICFVILSLMALVFWGKVLAIVCTSIWLYLIPRSSSAENEEGCREELRMSKFSNRLA